MNEASFYESIEKGELVDPGITEDYIPTVEEMKEKGADKTPEKYLPMLTFIASDPYKREGNESYTHEYTESVKFAKKILSSIPLDEN